MRVRGFVFSMDMVFATVGVLIFLSLFAFVILPHPNDTHVLLQLRAKDAALAGARGFAIVDFPEVKGQERACVAYFVRAPSVQILDPLADDSWVSASACEVSP